MTLVDVYYKYQKEYSEKYGNKTIVLMEVGSFYEMYATKEDSSYIKNVCDLLNILLTRKNKNIPVSPKNPYMGGIVSTSIDKYMRVQLEHNYTVERVEELNPNSLKKITCFAEKNIYDNTISTYQFERHGFFHIDDDSSEENLIFNRTVTLKDSWKKGI